MNEITLPMALLDFVPVILCCISVSVQMKDLNGRMRREDLVLFSAGGVMLVTGGFFKALWKLLYALNICDYPALTDQFFPNQAVAFVLLGYTAFRFALHERKTRLNAAYAAVPVVTTNIPFYVMMFWGMCFWYLSMAVYSFRQKRRTAVLWFLAAFVVMAANAAFGSRFDRTQGIMHWLAESGNSVGQLFLMLGTLSLHRAFADEPAGQPERLLRNA